VVADTLHALAALGAAGRARARASVVAVTGSVGKTGTKDMCALALGAFGSVHASRGSFNNQFGLPLTLARLSPETDFCVVEMGMNHAGEIAALTRIARPHVAVITAVEAAHLEFFADLDDIASAKAEIFEGVPAGGTAVLNRDNPLYLRLAAAARAQGVERIVGFGTLPGCDVRLIAWQPAPGRNRVQVEAEGRSLAYTLALDGRHWALDSLAVLAAVVALGLDVERAAAALAAMHAPAGRGTRHALDLACGRVVLIDDSYNASPASMRAAFELLADIEPARGGRRIAVLGDMLELGAEAEHLHAALALDVERAGIDLVFTAGPLMAALREALPAARRGAHAEAADALVAPLLRALSAGDVVLVKGSRAAAMDKVVEALHAEVPDGEGGDWPLAAEGDR
jgi:UDP-N-acetylmuramoyl-tripeptide--D-alanyl-D-alanine ligase